MNSLEVFINRVMIRIRGYGKIEPDFAYEKYVDWVSNTGSKPVPFDSFKMAVINRYMVWDDLAILVM